MTKQLEIDYAFGYVYDKSKLIVMYPVGSNIIDEKEYEMEVEVAFLEDGIDVAFEEDDIKEANETMKPLETFLMKPRKIIPFITSIKDFETKEKKDNLLKDFDKEYELKEDYIKKGYQIVDMYNVFQNVVNYIPKENLDNLNILKLEKQDFDMDNFIKTIKENLDEAINPNLVVRGMEKSNLTDRLFIKSNKNINANYILFATDINTYSQGILCANNEVLKDLDIDMGDLEISDTKDIGYLVEQVDEYLTFKIANYNTQTANNNQIAQIVDYSGVFKKMMIDFVYKFVK